MNKDQVKGSVKEVAGKLQKNVGEIVGNPTQQARGAAKELQGQAQQVLGDGRMMYATPRRIYRWNADGAGAQRAWFIDVPDHAREAEFRYLHEEIYGRAIDINCRKIDAYDRRREGYRPFVRQRDTKRFGTAQVYGWSEDKARQYAEPLRADFGAFVRAKGFKLD